MGNEETRKLGNENELRSLEWPPCLILQLASICMKQNQGVLKCHTSHARWPSTLTVSKDWEPEAETHTHTHTQRERESEREREREAFVELFYQ